MVGCLLLLFLLPIIVVWLAIRDSPIRMLRNIRKDNRRMRESLERIESSPQEELAAELRRKRNDEIVQEHLQATERQAPGAGNPIKQSEPPPSLTGSLEELERLARLRDSGVLTEAEFLAIKSRLLQK